MRVPSFKPIFQWDSQAKPLLCSPDLNVPLVAQVRWLFAGTAQWLSAAAPVTVHLLHVTHMPEQTESRPNPEEKASAPLSSDNCFPGLLQSLPTPQKGPAHHTTHEVQEHYKH